MEVGIDIVEIDRFKKMPNIESFLNKYFSKEEIAYIQKKGGSAQTMAGIFSAKEALLKALEIGIGAGIKLCELSVLHKESGKPYFEVTPQLNYYLNQKNCSSVSVSISHDGNYAIANCLIY
jgi:phosphopantetheine--protein transferase-like protein